MEPDQVATWEKIATLGPLIVTPAMVLDPEGRRALTICGGGSSYTSGVRQLRLDGRAEWLLIETVGRPISPRRSLAAIYEPKHRRAIIYGGYDGTFLADVWQLTLERSPTWSRLAVAGEGPPPLAAAAAVYDSKRDRMLLIHGNDGIAPDFRYGGVWALNLSGRPRWQALTPAGPSPAPRSAHSAVYDPMHDRVIVFGGSTSGLESCSDELWELRLQGRGAWRKLELPEPRPGGREEHSAVVDSRRQEMLIYGGFGDCIEYGRAGTLALHDGWALSLGDAPVWRRLPDGPERAGRWGHRAVFDPQHSRMIVAGGWGGMGSTLALVNEPEVRAPRALVAAKAPATPSSPADLPLRLAVRMPNPTRGALAMELALPTRGARLELFDVTGRRVAQRELSDLGPGFVRYRWDATEQLPAGIYLMRLSRAKETVKKKVILLH
ncbi:MAG TPA: T9SS type A sorting domain-containing protein [Candidatus Eisenbacteria bacterium]|nr:T9SS type A sorting domain-containing protein [Candidatus Eisenbacteria bacterium]